MRWANSPSAQTPGIPGNSNLSNLAVLLVSFPQVVFVGLKHHVAYEETVAGLLAGVARFCCSFVRTMSVFKNGTELDVDVLLEPNVCLESCLH